MIKLYKFPFINRAERVVWTLNELGLTYEEALLNPMQDDTLTTEHLAINPSGKTPTIEHEGNIYFESLAIMEYLNDRHPNRPLTQ